MRVGGLRVQFQRALIGAHRLLHPAAIFEQDREIEVPDELARRTPDRLAVVALGVLELVILVVETSQVDVRVGVVGIAVQG